MQNLVYFCRIYYKAISISDRDCKPNLRGYLVPQYLASHRTLTTLTTSSSAIKPRWKQYASSSLHHPDVESRIQRYAARVARSPSDASSTPYPASSHRHRISTSSRHQARQASRRPTNLAFFFNRPLFPQISLRKCSLLSGSCLSQLRALSN